MDISLKEMKKNDASWIEGSSTKHHQHCYSSFVGMTPIVAYFKGFFLPPVLAALVN